MTSAAPSEALRSAAEYLPLIDHERHVDVVVVGGGTAGFVSAIAAARNGADTLLVEQMPALGGTHAFGAMVMGTIGSRVTGPTDTAVAGDRELVVGGIALEYYDELLAERATAGVKGKPENVWLKDIEASTVVIERMVRESGAALWLTTSLIDTVGTGGTVQGVVVTRGAGGMTLVHAKTVIDATGDGFAAVRAGAAYETGRPSDGKAEAATLYFDVAGVDVERLLDHLEQHPEEISRHHRDRGVDTDALRASMREKRPFVVRIGPGYEEALRGGTLPVPVGGTPERPPSFGTFWMHYRRGQWVTSSFSVNIDTTYDVDPLDRDDFSEKLVDSRNFVKEMVRHYTETVPGFESAYLSRFANQLGTREGPRILGRYQLTGTDVFAPSDFDDAVGRCGVRVDIHPEDADGRDFMLRAVGGDRGWYQVPFRCLVARDLDGLLMAGRNISADHIAHGSMRHQVPCMMTGHAAGTAGARAAKLGVAVGDLDAGVLQAALREQGAII